MDHQQSAGLEKFVFKGKAGEWFGIWIVNILLSIITIGIYSAWAKVRTKKYFYNNTYVAGRNFDYHATGKQILIGRIIVVAVLVVMQIALTAMPIVGLVILAAIFLAFPWLIVRSMAFNALMSSWSNVRFRFERNYKGAYWVYLILPVLLYLALAILGGVGAYLIAEQGQMVLGLIPIILLVLGIFFFFPIYDRALKRYSINHHSLGSADITMNAPLRPFVIAQIVAMAWVVIVGGLSAVLIGFNPASFVEAMENLDTPGGDPTEGVKAILLFYVLFFVAFLPAGFLYQALVRNAVYGATLVDGKHQMSSNVSPWKLMWIVLSNLVVVICTLGLMLPWAQVRLARYLADHTAVLPQGTLDDFATTQQAEASALGDAYTDIEGVDVGLPI